MGGVQPLCGALARFNAVTSIAIVSNLVPWCSGEFMKPKPAQAVPVASAPVRAGIPGFSWLSSKNKPNFFFRANARKTNKKTQKHTHTQNSRLRTKKKAPPPKSFHAYARKNNHLLGVAQISQKRRNFSSGFLTVTQSQPRLGLVMRSRVATQPHFPGVCHWAGEPTRRQAAESPSRRAAKPASARQLSSARSRQPQGQLQTHHVNAVSRHHRVPHVASSRRSPSRVSRAWPFAVARATQVFRRNHNQSGTVSRVIAIARSDHPTATGESEPSVTLPRTSPPAIGHRVVPTGTHSPELPSDRRDRHKREPRAGPAPTTALKASHKVHCRLEERLGVARIPDRAATILSRKGHLATSIYFSHTSGSCRPRSCSYVMYVM